MVPNEELRYKMERALNTDEVAEPNVFAVEAAVAAFTKGDSWLDSLRKYLAENKKTVWAFLEAEIPNIAMVKSHATYLLWLDCHKITEDASELCQYLRNKTGLYLSAGMVYGGNGSVFLRMNIACQRERLLDGLERLKKGIKSYEDSAGWQSSI